MCTQCNNLPWHSRVRVSVCGVCVLVRQCHQLVAAQWSILAESCTELVQGNEESKPAGQATAPMGTNSTAKTGFLAPPASAAETDTETGMAADVGAAAPADVPPGVHADLDAVGHTAHGPGQQLPAHTLGRAMHRVLIEPAWHACKQPLVLLGLRARRSAL